MKPIFLLDVNVLIAAAWPTHRARVKVQAWLANPVIPSEARDLPFATNASRPSIKQLAIDNYTLTCYNVP